MNMTIILYFFFHLCMMYTSVYHMHLCHICINMWRHNVTCALVHTIHTCAVLSSDITKFLQFWHKCLWCGPYTLMHDQLNESCDVAMTILHKLAQVHMMCTSVFATSAYGFSHAIYGFSFNWTVLSQIPQEWPPQYIYIFF